MYIKDITLSRGGEYTRTHTYAHGKGYDDGGMMCIGYNTIPGRGIHTYTYVHSRERLRRRWYDVYRI